MWSEVAFILVLILTSVGWAENDRSYEFDSCVNGSVRSFEFAKEVIEESAYCFDKSREFFVSEDCEKKESVKETAKTPQESRREGLGSLETSSCEAFRKMENKLPFAWSDVLGPQGTPASKICEKLGGHLEIVEFKIKEEWTKSSRCVFSDRSFVSGAKLIFENKNLLRGDLK